MNSQAVWSSTQTEVAGKRQMQEHCRVMYLGKAQEAQRASTHDAWLAGYKEAASDNKGHTRYMLK